MIFFLFFLEIETDIPNETICIKCHTLCSRKNKKNISKCCLLKFLPSMQSVKVMSNLMRYICDSQVLSGTMVTFLG